MDKEIQKTKLTFNDSGLIVDFWHLGKVRQDEVDWLRMIYQERFSQRAGFEVPLEEIVVKPVAGEVRTLHTSTLVRLEDTAPSFHLIILNRRDPEVISRVIEEIDAYKGRVMGRKRLQLVEKALEELSAIIQLERRGR